jgi:hypothetical protein
LQPCLTPNALMVSLDKNIILQLDLFCRKWGYGQRSITPKLSMSDPFTSS